MLRFESVHYGLAAGRRWGVLSLVSHEQVQGVKSTPTCLSLTQCSCDVGGGCAVCKGRGAGTEIDGIFRNLDTAGSLSGQV